MFFYFVKKNKFTPEQLGIQASSALGWFLFEIFIIYLSLQILSIKSTLKTFDIIAFCGYKFFGYFFFHFFFVKIVYFFSIIKE